MATFLINKLNSKGLLTGALGGRTRNNIHRYKITNTNILRATSNTQINIDYGVTQSIILGSLLFCIAHYFIVVVLYMYSVLAVYYNKYIIVIRIIPRRIPTVPAGITAFGTRIRCRMEMSTIITDQG